MIVILRDVFRLHDRRQCMGYWTKIQRFNGGATRDGHEGMSIYTTHHHHHHHHPSPILSILAD